MASRHFFLSKLDYHSSPIVKNRAGVEYVACSLNRDWPVIAALITLIHQLIYMVTVVKILLSL